MEDTTKVKQNAGRLKGWYFEEEDGRLVGNLHNDPRFAEGERIRTSTIQKATVDIYHSRITVETRNSIYELDLRDYGSSNSAHQ